MSRLKTMPTRYVLSIECPEWCEVDSKEHGADLGEWDGHLIHETSWSIFDPTGRIHGWPATTTPHSPIRLTLAATTDLEGCEVETPSIIIDGTAHSLEQALLLAEAIKDTIEDYVCEGGELRDHGHDWREQFEAAAEAKIDGLAES